MTTDAKEVPVCACGDDWHANNAANHSPSCPVLEAFAALTSERDEARRDGARYSAMLENIVEGYDWWTVDEYDRCMTHGVRNPIDDARTLLAARTADAGHTP